MRRPSPGCVAALLVLLLLLIVPAAAAQPPRPYIETQILIGADRQPHREIHLDENGRGHVPTTVAFRVVGTVTCTQTTRYAMEAVIADDFPPWAGASLNPEGARRVTFQLGPGDQSDTPWQYATGPSLELAWDLESAPRDPTYTYALGIDRHAVASGTSDACTPMLSGRQALHEAGTVDAIGPPTPNDDQASGIGGGAPGALLPLVLAALATAHILHRRPGSPGEPFSPDPPEPR